MFEQSQESSVVSRKTWREEAQCKLSFQSIVVPLQVQIFLGEREDFLHMGPDMEA